MRMVFLANQDTQITVVQLQGCGNSAEAAGGWLTHSLDVPQLVRPNATLRQKGETCFLGSHFLHLAMTG
jgi:hypothetical protein